MTNMTVARTLLLLVVCFVAVQAERKFINLLPSVAPGAQAIGHENGVNGGGKLNQFGKVGVVPSYMQTTLRSSSKLFVSQQNSKRFTIQLCCSK